MFTSRPSRQELEPRPYRSPSVGSLPWGIRSPCVPNQWAPTLILNPALVGGSPSWAASRPGNDGAAGSPAHIPLVTREMNLPADAARTFFLDRQYHVMGMLPRSFFVVLKLNHAAHHFVFDFPDHPWFRDLFGLRQSCYVRMRVENSTEEWDLHLKPSLDSSNLFGYIYRRSDLRRIIVEQQQALLQSRRLPLVFDLDDTLVRVVGNNDPRYVTEREAARIPHRVRDLEDGRKIVLGDRVHEFLEWAHQFYEISVCSLGDPNYVKMVVKVLDPSQTWIKGILYSARPEYNHNVQAGLKNTPAKNLLAIYAFCTLSPQEYRGSLRAPAAQVVVQETGNGGSSILPPSSESGTLQATSLHLPLVIDDMPSMWAPDQQDNVISVRDRRGQNIWDVALFPMVQHVLSYVHTEFFRRLDMFSANQRETDPPSASGIYKDYLRGMLREQIGSTPVSTPRSQQSTPPGPVPLDNGNGAAPLNSSNGYRNGTNANSSNGGPPPVPPPVGGYGRNHGNHEYRPAEPPQPTPPNSQSAGSGTGYDRRGPGYPDPHRQGGSHMPPVNGHGGGHPGNMPAHSLHRTSNSGSGHGWTHGRGNGGGPR
ncbi:hypothetical protein IWQ60_006824 [Tieghemiomyces parasiticus]|uniref:protein-serine/threonine phosphatase n=1 Tax=Tieghemiomyces parasiticus TaxID=78921 RepID=A0A9W8AB10_9FUNG|nr:hypothetical protein IWQ60_006824 [Tieghemiomyces parasiticus]